MEKHRYFSKLYCTGVSSSNPPLSVAFLLILILALFPACTKKMSLEEAKQVSLSMSGKSFVPPPRRIDDILTVLEQAQDADLDIHETFRAKSSQSPPPNATSSALAYFYYNRGDAAAQIGRHNQALADLRLALSYSSGAGPNKHRLLNSLAYAEFVSGNFRRAIELFRESLRVKVWPSTYNGLVKLYARIGDLDSAVEVEKRGIALCNQLQNQPGWGTWPRIHALNMKAYVLEAQGKFTNAEPYYRRVLDNWTTSMKRQYPMAYIVAGVYLARNLKNQGRLVEAEWETRETLKEALGMLGRDSEVFGSIIGDLGEVLLRQGRLAEAEKLMRAAIQTMAEANTSSDSYIMADGRIRLGKVLIAKRDFTTAMDEFDLAKSGMKENRYLYENYFSRNPDIMLSLMKTGRLDEAMELISAVYEVNSETFGKQHYLTAEILGLRGVANSMMEKPREALEDFSAALPVLLESRSVDSGDYSKGQRLRIIIEAYMDLLGQIRGSQLENETGINALEKAFELADVIRGHTVQSAIEASSARTAVVDPDLADLVRQEQDTLKQIDVLQTTLANSIAAPQDQQLPKVNEELKRKIDILTKARTTLLDEIERRFPKYSDFTNPQPVTLSPVQNQLRPGEALIYIYAAATRTYVWAIPHEGEVIFAIVPLGGKRLSLMVFQLRMALDPDPRAFGDIPEFDLSLAYQLYNELLKPVERGYRDAADLLIVTHGPLGQLPFSVLPTAPVRLGEEKEELFSEYRQVPWLIRKVSITRLPSAASLVTLRTLPQGDPQRKAFLGFGDPFFNQEQLARSMEETASQKLMYASRGENLHVRSIRVTEKGNLDSEGITSTHSDMLNRLPDTAEELRSIAEALGADPTRDIFLGENASERQVKTMDLSDRRVIAFATHALVPGDLDGLDQPALALCSPSVTGDREDGLLTMGEIMKLRMDADWVVLSACNTGAADGAGAEAVSGLGRAFFYAGTRALLVSMWPVETTSAKKLTTGLFRHQRENPTLSRARALRKSMLELIDGSGLKDSATDKIVASYAHPLFWAPFIVVGEKGVAP